MNSPEEKAQKIFGERAAFYTTSPAHKDPQVLARVVELARPKPDWNALDIATGSGHTAFALAPYVSSVTGIDITIEMLQEAERLKAERAVTNVVFRAGDVHHLAFDNGSFQLVTCRRAAHHFSDIRLALQEIRRVLSPGGRVVIDDRSVPEDDFADSCMNLLDTYHDESHVREYRPSKWRRMLADSGFDVEAVEPYTLHRPVTSLTEGVSEENVRKVHETVAAFTPAQREVFNLTEKDGQLHLNHWYVLVAAVKRSDSGAVHTVESVIELG
jgi:ubiquinone/menaquinone biosynthesis C-methylase UbiE